MNIRGQMEGWDGDGGYPKPSADDSQRTAPGSIAWISVDDNLPKDDRLVLVWDKDWYELARYDREDQGGCWKDITSYLRGVKFWAYLPEPPKQ